MQTGQVNNRLNASKEMGVKLIPVSFFYLILVK